MPDNSRLKIALAKVIEFYKRLDTRQKLYLNFIVIIIFFAIASVFLSTEKRKMYFILVVIYWSSIVVFETVSIYKKLYAYTVGKVLLLIGFTLCTNISLSIAGVVINDITTVAPSNFPHSLILISIAIIPLMTAAVMLVIYTAIFVTLPIWGFILFVYDNNLKKIVFPGYEPQDGSFLYKTTRLIQVLSLGIYCVFFYSFFHSILDDYTKFLYAKSESFIYTFEMYGKSPCIGLPSGKVAFINDEHVLIAQNENKKINFVTSECVYKNNK